MNQTLHSYHVFMFPFKWQHWKGVSSEAPMDERFNLKSFEENLERSQGKSEPDNQPKWYRSKYDLVNGEGKLLGENYNEYNYFYSHIREILYDLSDKLRTTSSQGNEYLLNHFEFKLNPDQSLNNGDWSYNIQVYGKEPFSLKIDSIHLNIYSTGTGVLVFHLRNFQYKEKEEILYINQYGRRLFPPFLQSDTNSVITGKPDETEPRDSLLGVKQLELPCAIWLSDGTEAEKSKYYEDFSNYEEGRNIEHGPFIIPKFISDLFPEKYLLAHEEEDKKHEEYLIYIRPVLDDRMFVMCWFGNDEIASCFSKPKRLKEKPSFPKYKKSNQIRQNIHLNEIPFYIQDKWWYKYVFVDAKDPGCGSNKLREELVENHSYTRWIEPYGTLYGISRYSFVAVTSSLNIAPSFLARHMQSLYYKMVELALVQRATILNYSDEITHVSDLAHQNAKPEKIVEDIADLYKHYILFINNIHFREVTAQEQGIELYDMLQKHMRINEEVKNLESEIEKLHNYASLEAEKRKKEVEGKRNKILAYLTIISAVFLPLSLMAGIIGSNFFRETFNGINFKENFDPNFWKRAGVLVLSSLIIILFIDFSIFKTKLFKLNRSILYLVFILLGIIFYCLPYLK